MIARVWREARRLVRPQRQFARDLTARADSARDSGRYHDAAVLYREAVRLLPERSDLAVQAGHMFKEARDFVAAESLYRMAERQRPTDADLQHQLGHFFKTIDRLEDAEAYYQRAADLVPDWDEPRAELLALRRRPVMPAISELDAPAPELVARPIAPAPHAGLDQIVLHALGGRPVKIADAKLPVLAGVEAVRGVCVCDRIIETAALYLDGVAIHQESIASVSTDEPGIFKAVFNLWVDLSAVAPGLHQLELVLTDQDQRTRRLVQSVLIAEPFADNDATRAADSIVFPGGDDSLALDARIRAAPSVIRPVARRLAAPPESILVLRTDQLGDIVVSIPAIRRLRLHFPAAKLVGLLTEANAALAAALALFDEIIVVDFPDDMERRQRTMSAADQRALQAKLLPYRFDVAIDLATSNVSRPVLKLTGARLTFGFDDDNCPWVDGGITGNVRDPRNRGETSPQSGRIVALVDRLATLYDTGAAVIPHVEPGEGRLATFGIGEQDRYVVLHLGARVAFSRWPGYPDLARALLARHDVKIVVLGNEIDVRTALANVPSVSERLIVLDQRLAFEDLDRLLGHAALFVGNDSGPKHLAALRGTPVVSIHCARISWAEWAQEQTGVVISRRVPCAGCALFHESENCAKDFACVTDIRVGEVLAAVEALLPRR